MAHYNATFNADQYTKATIGGTTLGHYHYMVLRAAASGDQLYYLRIYGQTMSIRRSNGDGTYTALTSDIAVTYDDGDEIKFEVVGDVLTAYINDSTCGVSATDSSGSKLTSGYPGLGSNYDDTWWDDWYGGNAA